MCPEAMLQQGGHGNRAQRRALQREQNKAAKKAAKKALKQGDAPATVSSKKMHRKRPATPISLSKMTPNGTSEEEEDEEIKDTRSLPGTPRPITRQAISGDATTIAPMHTPTMSQSSNSNSSKSSSNSDAVDSIVLMTTPVPSNTSEFSELVSETNGSDNHGSAHDAPETPKMEDPMATEPMTTPIPSNHTHAIDHDASIAPKEDETVPSNIENSTCASSEPSASSEPAQKTKNAAEGDKKEKKEALASLEMNKHEAVAAPSSCVGDEHPEDGEIMVIASPMEMVHEQKPNKTPISTTAALASKATTMTRKSSMMDEIDDQAPLTEWVTQHSLLCDSRAPSLHAPDLEKDDHSSSSSSSAASTATATTTITAHAVDDIASTLKRSTSCTLSEKDVDNIKDIPNSADHGDDHAMKQGPCEPSEPNKPLAPKAAAVVAPKTAKIHRLLVATLKKKTKQLKRSYAFWKPKSHVTRDDALKMP